LSEKLINYHVDATRRMAGPDKDIRTVVVKSEDSTSVKSMDSGSVE